MNKDNATWLDAALAQIAKARVAVFGDFCLDAYWLIDPSEAERSVETGLPVRRVRSQRYSLGGAGNVVANLAALGIAKLFAVGLIGDDMFGRTMRELLDGFGADRAGLLADQPDLATLVYAKPYVGDRELNRLDFGSFDVISAASIETLANRLDAVASQADAVVLNQQIPAGISSPAMIERINAIIARHSRCRFLVDSRDRAELYRGAILKLNGHEAARLLGVMNDKRSDLGGTGSLPASAPTGRQAARATLSISCEGLLAKELAARTGQPVFVTRGENGIVAADGDAVHEVAGIRIDGPTDPVGAGDTVAASLAAALAGGCDIQTAARLANLAASVTVRKLQTTGTASPAEIRAAALLANSTP
jgi:bifunctional ADP-heptose synthase (sugar kinase/adenylyltransferase)